MWTPPPQSVSHVFAPFGKLCCETWAMFDRGHVTSFEFNLNHWNFQSKTKWPLINLNLLSIKRVELLDRVIVQLGRFLGLVALLLASWLKDLRGYLKWNMKRGPRKICPSGIERGPRKQRPSGDWFLFHPLLRLLPEVPIRPHRRHHQHPAGKPVWRWPWGYHQKKWSSPALFLASLISLSACLAVAWTMSMQLMAFQVSLIICQPSRSLITFRRFSTSLFEIHSAALVV